MNLQHKRIPPPARVLLLCGLALCFGSAAAQATTMLNNGSVNIINGASDDIVVSNGPGDTATVVNVMAGADIAAPVGLSASLTQDSVFLMTGGTAQGDIEMADNTVAFIQGAAGVGGNIVVGGSSELQISADAQIGGEVEVTDNAIANFMGGEADTFGVFGNAVATINGGSIDDDMDVGDDGVLNVIDVFVNDDVDAEGNGIMNLMGGIYDEDVEAAESSTINIIGGEFIRIFSDGANLVASGGTINATGGVFGAAGAPQDGEMSAAGGGVINMIGAEIAGAGDGTASAVVASASLNAEINFESMAFGDLSTSSATGALVDLTDITASALEVSAIAGSTIIDATSADSLNLLADLSSSVVILGGLFDSSTINSQGGSVIEIIGTDFLVNGIPLPFGDVPFISGDIKGTLADGSAFDTLFSRGFSSGSRIVIVNAIPEPMSALLASLAAPRLLGSLQS